MPSSSTVDFDAPATKVLSPATLAHVVLRTANLQPMVDFYTEFLGGTITYSNEVISFITYDEEHHRIALLRLEHIAFTHNSLTELLLAYRQRKARGILPIWCVNHGPTTSIYYKDPDGNMLETQVDNFDTVEEATAFMMGDRFSENPIGADFDAEEMIAAIKRGEDERVLKTRREVGPRGLPDLAGK